MVYHAESLTGTPARFAEKLRQGHKYLQMFSDSSADKLTVYASTQEYSRGWQGVASHSLMESASTVQSCCKGCNVRWRQKIP